MPLRLCQRRRRGTLSSLPHSLPDMNDVALPPDIESDPRVKALTWKYIPDVKTCQAILQPCPLGAGHTVALNLASKNGANVILVIQKVCGCELCAPITRHERASSAKDLRRQARSAQGMGNSFPCN